MTAPFATRLRFFARVAGQPSVFVDGEWLDVPPAIDAYALIGRDVAGYAEGGRVLRMWEQLTIDATRTVA